MSNDKVAATFHGGAERGHEPLIYTTGRYGCWGECLCGWSSGTWTSPSGVHIEFGKHLLAVAS